MKKKILSMVLALVMMLTFIPAVAVASDDAYQERYEHNLKLFNESEVKRALLEQMPEADAEIPEEIITLAKSITGGITGDYDKARAICDWVSGNIWYNYDYYYREITPIYTAPLDVLQYKHTVCEGYAWLTMYLLRAIDIPAVYVRGTAKGTARWGGHAWNEAYVEGEWIIVDTTWNSNNRYKQRVFSEQQPGVNTYFDMSMELLSERHRVEEYRIQRDSFETPHHSDSLDTASDWAREGIIDAIWKSIVPIDLMGDYTNNITRQEFCSMAVLWVERVLEKNIEIIVMERGIPERLRHTFSDTGNPRILSAYRLGIISGTVSPTADTPGQFSPDGELSREQAAVMIMNACKAIGADVSNPPTADFGDMDKAASWAQPGVNFVRANGIMSGDGTNFNPSQPYTREQSIITFNNIKHDELAKAVVSDPTPTPTPESYTDHIQLPAFPTIIETTNGKIEVTDLQWDLATYGNVLNVYIKNLNDRTIQDIRFSVRYIDANGKIVGGSGFVSNRNTTAALNIAPNGVYMFSMGTAGFEYITARVEYSEVELWFE